MTPAKVLVGRIVFQARTVCGWLLDTKVRMDIFKEVRKLSTTDPPVFLFKKLNVVINITTSEVELNDLHLRVDLGILSRFSLAQILAL